MLSTRDHNRFQEGYQYVYPVVSRRAGGVSLGINLNTNNACNWRCIYCQVPDLVRGAPPAVDVDALKQELSVFLNQILIGSYLQDCVPEEQRRLNDIAFSGNGEPTSAPNFVEAVDVVKSVRAQLGVPEAVKTVLITNGSLIHRKNVILGIEKLADINGEVWFKIDRATPDGIRSINDTRANKSRMVSNLNAASRACPTWIQTCLFKVDGMNPSGAELDAYVDLIQELQTRDIPFKGILLYGLARQPFQPEAARLAPVESAWFEGFSGRLRELGVTVKLSI
jgi:wyosine [tRNA(Phe)-imidazoG37] synthetase (radical SAM superfamily)